MAPRGHPEPKYASPLSDFCVDCVSTSLWSVSGHTGISAPESIPIATRRDPDVSIDTESSKVFISRLFSAILPSIVIADIDAFSDESAASRASTRLRLASPSPESELPFASAAFFLQTFS